MLRVLRPLATEGLVPRYYIDTDDGDFRHHDEDGHDLPDVEAARRAALAALPDMARERCRTVTGGHSVRKCAICTGSSSTALSWLCAASGRFPRQPEGTLQSVRRDRVPALLVLPP